MEIELEKVQVTVKEDRQIDPNFKFIEWSDLTEEEKQEEIKAIHEEWDCMGEVDVNLKTGTVHIIAWDVLEELAEELAEEIKNANSSTTISN